MDIGEFLFSSHKRSLCCGGRVREAWENLKNYYDDQIPKELERRFIEESWSKDYILENLQTHDWKSLAERLKPEFGNNYVEAVPFVEDEDDRRTFCITLKGTKEHPLLNLRDWVKMILSKDTVQHLLDFYNYSFREVRLNATTLDLWFEPKFTESANDFIFNKCHGVVYHITTADKLPSILNSGLRCKTNEKWTGRIYFWAHEPQKLSKTVQDIKRFVEEDLYSDEVDVPDWKEDIVVIRFRLWSGSMSRNRIPVYRDTAMNTNAFFTYTSVPKEDIDKVIKWPGQD